GAKRRYGSLAAMLAQRLGQGLEHLGGAVGWGAAHRGEERFEVGGLVVLLRGQRHVYERLGDTGVDPHGQRRAGWTLRAQDLEALIVHRRGDVHAGGVRHPALAREAAPPPPPP